MKAILPVAGYGTRLRPHTNKIQKTLLPVAGKPALDFIIEPLFAQGIRDITFIIGHLGEQIVEYMQRYDGNFTFVEQTEQLGLGHAVLQGLEDSDEPVIVQLGDTIFDVDLQRLTATTANRIAVGEVADPSRFGIVELNGVRIIRFHEKPADPPTNLAIAGLYYFPRQKVLKRAIERLIERDIRTKQEYQITDAFSLMLADGEPFEAFLVEKWYDAGVPETYLETNRALLQPDHGNYPGVTIIEPVHIGADCVIRDSTIGPYVTIMDRCVIRHCHIRDSIVLAGSHLQELDLSHCIVGGDGSERC
jgi:glucose-1-phosphate thymidylyltransferase